MKEEIKLLKTFIIESYNNLTDLRHAEHISDAEARSQPLSTSGSHPAVDAHHEDGSKVYSSHEPPMPQPPSVTSSAFDSDSEGPMPDYGATHNDADDADIKDQRNQEGTEPVRVSNAQGLMSKVSFQPRSSYNASDLSIHRESNLLLQMVPYRPSRYDSIRSDHLLSSGPAPDGGAKPAVQEAIESVRLLLDKWTASGSALVSNILDEEAAAAEKSSTLVER